MTRILLFPAIILATTSLALAEGPHEHGVGNMNVVIDKSELLIELEIPGADIVGFEHPAVADADISAVQSALKTLDQATTLFQLAPDAGCTLHSTSLETDLLEDDSAHGSDDDHDDHAKEGDHGHEDHAHDDHHEHDAHDEHDEEIHGSFRAVYEFDCATPDALDGVATTLFEVFPSLESLRAQSVGLNGQSAQDLSRDSSVLGL